MESKQIVDLLFFLVPAVLVFATAYFLLRKFLDNQYKLKVIETRLQTQKDVMPLKLQAYERLTLFLERISPNNLLGRTYQPGLSVRELHLELLGVIKQEFEHNITQQIYVSPQVWAAVRSAREDVVKLINTSAAALDPQGRGAELNKKIFERLLEGEAPPTQPAIDLLKEEVNRQY